MLKIPIEEIIKKIKDKTGLDEKLIEKKINDKVEELSGLVSREGAAHIVANEFGIQLFQPTKTGLLKIKNIVPGLKTASVVGRVLRIYPVREFKTKKGSEGKVVSFLVGDSTGRIRIVFWNTNQIKLIEDGNLNEGDIIKVTNSYVKEGLNGLELHARSASLIEVNPDILEAKEIPPLEDLWQVTERTKIKNITDEGTYEIRGAVVNIMENNPFFDVCPECGRRLNGNICEEHGEVTPKKSMFISTIVDDGTDNIRVVFFGRQAEKLLGISSEEAFKLSQEHNNPFYPIDVRKFDILGRELIIEGKVSKNDFSGELEMIARRVTLPNPVVEAKKLVKELEK
jgi:replication factor A1